MVSHKQAYVFDPRPNFPFIITAKRYWHPTESAPDGLTVIFAHGTGFTKESWEPTIDDIYGLIARKKGGNVKIREMWSIDCPSHGEAIYHNEKALRFGYDVVFQWEIYGRAIHSFLAGLGSGVDVDFSKRKLVGIGHSMGAVSFILSTTFQPAVDYLALFLVEPMIFAPEYRPPLTLDGGAAARRDMWPSKEEAYNVFKTRSPWKDWDDRVLRTYVDFGLRSLPTIDYPDKTKGVTLACNKTIEAATYRDRTGRDRAYDLLPHVVRRMDMHFIYGAIDEYVDRPNKDQVLRKASGDVRKLASLHRVEGAGHLVVQAKPTQVATVLVAAMNGDRGELDCKKHIPVASARL